MELAPDLANSPALAARDRAVDPEVLQHYWRAQEQMYTLSIEGINTAIEEFQAAIAKDSSYARAWAGLAVAYDLLSFYTDSPPEEFEALIDDAADRAIALNDQLWESHYAHGVANDPLTDIWYGGDYSDTVAAEAAYRRAIELEPSEAMPLIRLADMYTRRLFPRENRRYEDAGVLLDQAFAIEPNLYNWWNVKFHHIGGSIPGVPQEQLDLQLELGREMASRFPTFPEAHHQFGLALQRNGYTYEAADAIRTAVTLDPNSPIRREWVVGPLIDIGETAQAVEEARRLIEAGYTFYSRLHTNAFAANGDFEVALAWTDSTEARGSAPLAVQDRAYVYARMGRRDDALTIIRDLEALDSSALALRLGILWTLLGDHDRAFEWLDRLEPPDPRWWRLVVDRNLSPLRDDPRYDALIAKHGLEQIAANHAASRG